MNKFEAFILAVLFTAFLLITVSLIIIFFLIDPTMHIFSPDVFEVIFKALVFVIFSIFIWSAPFVMLAELMHYWIEKTPRLPILIFFVALPPLLALAALLPEFELYTILSLTVSVPSATFYWWLTRQEKRNS